MPSAYRDFVFGSAGEFSCAKSLYVGLTSGWFSDRSACFLAAGRPVVLQDTGLTHLFGAETPGLRFVRTPEEAADAIRAIRGNFAAEACAARAIAAEHFDTAVI